MKPDYLNDDELEKTAPGLSKLKKENPFVVPENYFESLAENIQQKINAVPDLERMKKDNPFFVPPGYFDSLPSTVQQRIIDRKKQNNVFGEWISIAFRPKYTLALASIIILLFFGIRYLTTPAIPENLEKYITLEDLQNFSYVAELDENMLIELLEQQNKNNVLEEDKSIEQYLIDNGIDVSQIENHL